MKNEDRIVELLIELVKGQNRLIDEVTKIRVILSQINTELSISNRRSFNLESHNSETPKKYLN